MARERERSALGPSLLVVAMAAATGFALGVLTAYAQGWLPDALGSLANSAGSWALVAFALSLLARDARVAAVCGAVSLATLLVGYLVAANVRDDATSSSLTVFWGAAALVVGPLLGLGANWVRQGSRPLAALGIGGMAGVLVGEGVYGLTVIADTTYPPYWRGEIVVGLLLLGAAVSRLRSIGVLALSLVITAATATAFVAIYRLDLISLTP